MSNHQFLDLLETSAPLLADGAMGTMLHAHGIGFDACFDSLNLTRPALVAEVHRAYIEAGADIILTNTFGANRYKLGDHGLETQVVAINQAGVELAQRVIAASFKDVLLAGDIGPLGVRLVPFGRVQLAQARAAFSEQIAALTEAGVDFILIETITDLHEVLEAIQAAREVSDLPVVASMTFTRDDRTLLGDPPTKVAQQIAEAGADVIGVNCSSGPAQIVRILRLMHQTIPEAQFWSKPNAGWPEQVAGRIMYPATPEYFAEYAWALVDAGATVVGGCCGTTPAHIAAMRTALDTGRPEAPLSIPQLITPVADSQEMREQPSQLANQLAAGDFVIAVEVDPPRGLSTHKLLAGASLLADAGANVINVADSPMARMRMSPWAVCNLIQQQLDIETTLHFPTRGRNVLRVQGDLLAAHALGIRNVFVVMGDPTSIGDYPEAMDNYDIVPSGLIKLIKQGFNEGLDHAGATIGYPTTFCVGGALNLTPRNPERQLKIMHRKIRSGVDFFLTQPVYDPNIAHILLEQYEAQYGPLEVPVLVGILPLYGVRHARFLHNEVPGITIAPEVFTRLEAAGTKAPYEGVRIASELVEQLKSWANGLYVMPAFGRYDLAAEIIAGAL